MGDCGSGLMASVESGCPEWSSSLTSEVDLDRVRLRESLLPLLLGPPPSLAGSIPRNGLLRPWSRGERARWRGGVRRPVPLVDRWESGEAASSC